MRCFFVYTVLLLASLSSVCLSGDKYPIPRADLQPESIVVETGSFRIGSETYRADFGTIVVMEKRSNPSSRLISIPFLRVHSLSKNPAEPVFGFAGGPGQTNMSWDRRKMSIFLPTHDFVLVGYRGVDGSIVLDCPEVTKALKDNDDPLSEESLRRIGQAWNAAAERLKAEGIDLDGYTMLDVIEDNESVRRALGYPRIDLLSESYGTRIAYLYGLKHQNIVSRSAMIAVNPPGHFVWKPETIDKLLRKYSRLWSRDSAMIRKSQDLYMTMSRVLKSMPRMWLLFPIDPGKVRVVTFALLFHRSTAALVFDAYAAAEKGDASGLALMSAAYDYVVPSLAIWGDMAAKAVSADFDSTRNYSACADVPGTILGSPMTVFSWGPLKYSRWPTRALPDEFRVPRRSEVRTLMLSGSVDFSTPPEFARDELLPCLPNGRQVVFSECGHVNDMWGVNPENIRLELTSFYDTGIPDTSKNSYMPMDFSVGLSFPTIAKLAVGVFVLIAMGLAVILVLIIRKCSGRRAGTES